MFYIVYKDFLLPADLCMPLPRLQVWIAWRATWRESITPWRTWQRRSSSSSSMTTSCLTSPSPRCCWPLAWPATGLTAVASGQYHSAPHQRWRYPTSSGGRSSGGGWDVGGRRWWTRGKFKTSRNTEVVQKKNKRAIIKWENEGNYPEDKMLKTQRPDPAPPGCAHWLTCPSKVFTFCTEVLYTDNCAIYNATPLKSTPLLRF